MARDFLTGEELDRDQLNALLDRAAELKAGRSAGEGRYALAGQSIALVFERPSTRTCSHSGHGHVRSSSPRGRRFPTDCARHSR